MLSLWLWGSPRVVDVKVHHPDPLSKKGFLLQLLQVTQIASPSKTLSTLDSCLSPGHFLSGPHAGILSIAALHELTLSGCFSPWDPTGSAQAVLRPASELDLSFCPLLLFSLPSTDIGPYALPNKPPVQSRLATEPTLWDSENRLAACKGKGKSGHPGKARSERGHITSTHMVSWIQSPGQVPQLLIWWRTRDTKKYWMTYLWLYGSFYHSDHQMPRPSEEIAWFLFFPCVTAHLFFLSLFQESSDTNSEINYSKCVIPYRIHFFIFLHVMTHFSNLSLPWYCFFPFSFIFHYVILFLLQITSNSFFRMRQYM